MEVVAHPEYHAVYIHNGDAAEKCQNAVAQWRADGTPIPAKTYELSWTVESARAFVADLATMFQAYNRVLWEQFSYCPTCGGQCCVVDASDIRAFDLIAVALLDEKAPTLAHRVETTPGGCIYLSGQRCTWPDAWRTIKCWSFYCLGSGPWSPDTSLHEQYSAVTEALQQVVQAHLPTPLHRYEHVHGASLVAALDDPVDFAHGLHRAIDALFVAPFHERYPLFDRQTQTVPVGSTRRANQGAPIALLDADIFAFIGEATEEISQWVDSSQSEKSPVDLEQMLADLETLEWILMGRPAHSRNLLTEMWQRYAGIPLPDNAARTSLAADMRRHLRYLLEHEFSGEGE